MTNPDDAPQVLEGTDVQADPQDLDVEEKAATTDPAQMSEDAALGGAAGQGGAG